MQGPAPTLVMMASAGLFRVDKSIGAAFVGADKTPDAMAAGGSRGPSGDRNASARRFRRPARWEVDVRSAWTALLREQRVSDYGMMVSVGWAPICSRARRDVRIKKSSGGRILGRGG
jgi:hypothetical protein